MEINYIVIITAVTICSLILIFGHIYLRSLRPDKIKEPNKDHSITRITENDLIYMIEIQNYLDSLVKELGIDRGIIYQYHNGGKFINGIGMKKYSLTYESTAPGVNRLKEISQNQFISKHAFLIQRLAADGIITAEKGYNEEKFLDRRLEELGIDQLMVVGLKDSNHNLIGSISFHSINNPIIITERIKTRLFEAARKISHDIQSNIENSHH